jgi:putative Mn2+ efflux pump MntP
VFRENAGVLARIVVFVLPLGLDTLTIAIALGLQSQRPLRPALLFVAFETTMPLIGMVIGRVVGLYSKHRQRISMTIAPLSALAIGQLFTARHMMRAGVLPPTNTCAQN